MDSIDSRELCKRVVKYILEGLCVAFAAMVLPKQKIDIEAVFALGLVAAATFAILDLFSPTAGIASRYGVGGALGVGLAGGLPLAA
jgi:ABC-type Co2+ transport system permease subunit